MKQLRIYLGMVFSLIPLLVSSADYAILSIKPTAVTSGHQVTLGRTALTGNYALACQTSEGTYLKNMNNYIYSPVISLPAGNTVLFDFQVRGSFADPDIFPAVDYWGCEVSPDAGTTWYYLSNPYGQPDGDNFVYSDAPTDWSSFVNSYSVDGVLNTYAGNDLQFRWFFQSDDDTPEGEGLFIDDVQVTVDGSTIYLADFEDGTMTGWVTEDATATPPMWHQTTVGSNAGQTWAMNDPELGTAGGYKDHWYQTLDSPPVALPAGQTNVLTFNQNRNVEDPAGADFPYDGWDGTNVRISNDGGATWTVLVNATPAYNTGSLYSFGNEFNEGPGVPGWGGSSGGWQAVSMTIPDEYAGSTVIIRFAFSSDPGYSTPDSPGLFGWLVDDINIAGILTNDGESNEGWVAASQVPVVGDIWHLSFQGLLPAPQNLSVVNGDQVIRLSWDAPESGTGGDVLSYNVYKKNPGSTSFDTFLQNISGTHIYDTDVVNGMEYTYVVSANYALREGQVSEEITALPVSATLIELIYDDNSAEAGFNIGVGGSLAVEFTPISYPTHLQDFKVFVNAADTGDVQVQILDDDGANGLPATVLREFTWNLSGPGWNTYEIGADTLWITSGSFYISLVEDASSPSFGVDTDGPFVARTYYSAGSGWELLSSIGLEYNLMIRATVGREIPVSIDNEMVSNTPHTYQLSQNFPNPFNPSTEIRYALPEASRVELVIYDLNGRQVDVLVQDYQAAGGYRVTVDGSTMDSGVYIYTLNSGNGMITRKMILLK